MCRAASQTAPARSMSAHPRHRLRAGATVSACIDGRGFTELTVGTLTLLRPGSVVTVGLPIHARAVTLPLDLGNPPHFARRKRVSKVHASLYNSSGLSVSTDEGKTFHGLDGQGAAAGPSAPNPYQKKDTGPALISGLTMRIPTPNWTQKGSFILQTDQPLPVTVTSISVDVELGD